MEDSILLNSSTSSKETARFDFVVSMSTFLAFTMVSELRRFRFAPGDLTITAGRPFSGFKPMYEGAMLSPNLNSCALKSLGRVMTESS